MKCRQHILNLVDCIEWRDSDVDLSAGARQEVHLQQHEHRNPTPRQDKKNKNTQQSSGGENHKEAMQARPRPGQDKKSFLKY